ncbi:hypothetical protein DPMN_104898 [Dreissena polymorpha]|uniref:Uncharacterized protein n=1 Tax=Dreissena polymorpha TaxID=45954 RepID=A0A9D4HCU9_DREPO|nr:hypothetical protein DPMN_104898 [Dreissena polymorpha]
MQDLGAGSDKEPCRKNACTAPPSARQIIVWSVLAVIKVIHFTTLVPELHNF